MQVVQAENEDFALGLAPGLASEKRRNEQKDRIFATKTMYSNQAL